MMQVDYETIGSTILLFWDDELNYNNPLTQQKIGPGLFQDVKLIQNLATFKQIVDNAVPDQKFLFLVHLHHGESNKGYDTFKSSSILRYYPGLNFHLISSAPKRILYEEDGNSQLDVYSYDNYQNKIPKLFAPQIKSQFCSEHSLLVDSPAITGTRGIFLSHTSKDAEMVEKFKDIILHGGLGFNLDRIKFTSKENHGIAGGIDIPENLRSFLCSDMGLFIQFITPDYLESRVCLNEEGAAWCLLDELMFLPILIPPCSSKDIAWVKVVNKGIKIANRDSLMNIYENRKSFFGTDVNVTQLSKKIDEFLEYYKTSKYAIVS